MFVGFLVAIVGFNIMEICGATQPGTCLFTGPTYSLGFLLLFAGGCAAFIGIVWLLAAPPRTVPDAADAERPEREEPLPEYAVRWGLGIWRGIQILALVAVEAILIYYLYRDTVGTPFFDSAMFLATVVAFGVGDVAFLTFMFVAFDTG